MTAGARGHVAGVFALACSAAEVGFAVLLGIYALAIADSNHAGLPLSWAGAFAVATGLVSGISLALRERGFAPRRLAWLLLAASVLAFVTVLGLERLDVMMEYEVWARKGMPPKPWGNGAL